MWGEGNIQNGKTKTKMGFVDMTKRKEKKNIDQQYIVTRDSKYNKRSQTPMNCANRRNQKRQRNLTTKKAQKISWSQVQERCFAECWIHIFECNKTEKSQTGESFWYRVFNIFSKDLAIPFTKDQLTVKWSPLNKAIKMFILC